MPSLWKSINKVKSDLLSGFATALFSIPEGMAYAKLAGVNPIYGLYSGMVATITSSLTTGTILMLSTLTSAIAISTHSVLKNTSVESSQLPTALFTLTFLIGVVMFILGLFRLGKIVNFVSNAVMTGFIVGASFLILVGELGDLVGYKVVGSNKFEHIINWITHISDWQLTTTAIGLSSILLMVIIQTIPRLKEAATIVVLLLGSLIVHLLHLPSVSLVRDIAKIPGAFPSFVLPDPVLMPKLALGAIAIALVALVQGAGVHTAIPNPKGKPSSYSRDFIGQGLGNLFGSFFQSMGTGGSLSRTAVSVEAGAKSRLGGIFAGIWLILIVLIAGHLIEFVPLAVISGILCVIAVQLIANRFGDIRLIFTTSFESALVMSITFLSALFIPLQWTIFLGASLSFIFYIYTSATEIRLIGLAKNKKGYLQEEKLPEQIPSNQITIISLQGNLFFAEVPVIRKLMPSINQTKHAVLIWRIRAQEEIHSTFLEWLKQFIKEFHSNENILFLEGVEPHVMNTLKKTKIIDLIGKENVFPAEPGIGQSLDHAIDFGEKQLSRKNKK